MRTSILVVLAVACSPADDTAPDFVPTIDVQPGVESATVVNGEPGAPYTLYEDSGEKRLTVIADSFGQAHFAYLPAEHVVLETEEGARLPVEDGTVLDPGTYTIRNDETGDSTGAFDVLAVDDVPDPSLYEGQTLTGIPVSLLPTDDPPDPDEGFQYIEVRDGTLLSAMVRFPDPALYGEGPYPTVIEYSGYSPSRPDRLDAGSQIANAMGYATVGVNMRGSGCSGGVFDVFNRAQHADGYDVVETVARQDWVLNNQVGMVGLSYPGISQLYVASTNPPSLAGIVPLSTIADAWQMQWPGGIYNAGFTRQWIDQRDAEASRGGKSWVIDRIDNGDATCEANTQLSAQNLDFEAFFRSLEYRPPDADDRDLNLLVEQIEAPVFHGGAWQDEQTGAQFGGLLDRYYQSQHLRALVYNGRHPDGFAPGAVFHWHEFLELYVAERVPEINPAIRALGANEFASAFGMSDYDFPEDRFEGMTYDEALAAYQAEDPITLLFESGAGGPVGEPTPVWTETLSAWPPVEAEPITWYTGGDDALAPDPGTGGAHQWRQDPDAGSVTFLPSYDLLGPLWETDWTRFEEGEAVAYTSAPFQEDVVLTGPGLAELHVNSPVDDATVQVTLTEVRPDGVEVYVQAGWLRLGHRAAEQDGLRLRRSFREIDYAPVPVDTWTSVLVEIPSFAHPFRAGSSLKMRVSTPGRDHATWEFEPLHTDDTLTFALGYGGDQATSLTLAELPGIDVPEGLPPCPSLRGQPCRGDVPRVNPPAE